MPKDKPLTDKRWFQTTQGILTLAGAAVGLIVGVITLWPKPDPEPSKQFTEIIVDSSEGMNAPFDGSTKMAAAQREITRLFESGLSTSDGFALRRLGGICGPQDTELLLGFDKATADSIEKKIGTLAPAGQNSLVHGIAEATGDFARIDRRNPKRLLVITGGGGRCDQDIDNLNRKLEQFKAVGGMGLDVHYVGMGLAPEDQNKLSEVAQRSGGEVKYVQTQKDLEQALHQIAVVEPTIADGRAILDILDSVVHQSNSALQSLNSRNYADAETELSKALDTWHQSDGNFAALKLRRGENFQQLIQYADGQRNLQKQALDTMGEMIQYAKSGNSEALKKAVAQYEDVRQRYNGNKSQIDDLLNQMGEHGG
jgi:hypothetical protein